MNTRAWWAASWSGIRTTPVQHHLGKLLPKVARHLCQSRPSEPFRPSMRSCGARWSGEREDTPQTPVLGAASRHRPGELQRAIGTWVSGEAEIFVPRGHTSHERTKWL